MIKCLCKPLSIVVALSWVFLSLGEPARGDVPQRPTTTVSPSSLDVDDSRGSSGVAMSDTGFDDSPQRRRFSRGIPGVYKSRIEARWFADDTKFWYRNDLREDTKEFLLVDAEKGTRLPAFDHAMLAESLSKAAGGAYQGDRLPFSEVEFAADGKAIQFVVEGVRWSCNLESYACESLGAAPPANEDRAPVRSGAGDRRQRSGRGRDNLVSPDDKWIASVREGNVYVRAAVEGSQEVQLSHDGTEEIGYGRLEWAPDSRTLVAFRIHPGDRKEVYLVESSPESGGRAQLHTRTYDLPGDALTSYELNLFDMQQQTQLKPAVERIDLGRPDIHWKPDGRHFAYQKVDRGHQRFRVINVDSYTGETFNVIDETTETFIWTAHTEQVDLEFVNWLDASDELIYVSERDGWRHLYLVDATEGRIKNQITQGEYVVRGIDLIDEENRQIWFRASGMHPDQDPYFIHYYRINFDGSGLVALTEGNGTHSIEYSPNRVYLVDTYSRVDMPPVHELRRVADGSLVCQIDEADITEFEESGATLPEVFVAKGRDNRTDIWGIICRPRDFDPGKKYAIIEQIYAGPHGSHVPKSFIGGERFSSLTELGFVVVQIDGMGTANRSKAFHNVCWHNLKDAGFPDRIRWIQAAARKYPYLDTDRVGIYGTSAGGQNSTGGVLFYPDFYKVAVSACGCHDNRMDKASWNEQWMGYPVGPQYSESSNIDNAHRLEGKLLLIVGEMDNNVPPESTLRLADALIKADKHFELLVVPGGGHGMGGAYGSRRMRDFFVRHLQGVEPPGRNRAASDRIARHELATEAEQDAADQQAGEQDSQQAAALDLAAIQPQQNGLLRVATRFRSDRSNLMRFYFVEESSKTRQRMKSFYMEWLAALVTLPTETLNDAERSSLSDLKDEILAAFAELQGQMREQTRLKPLVPFAESIIELAEGRLHADKIDAPRAAARVSQIAQQIDEIQEVLRNGQNSGPNLQLSFSTEARQRAADVVESLSEHLTSWYAFYNGYDPEFTWWMRAPFQEAQEKLETYTAFLRESPDSDAGDQTVTSPAPSSEPSASSTWSAPQPEGDVPDLEELLSQEQTRMELIIEKFQSETRRGRGRRGEGSRRRGPGGQRAQSAETTRQGDDANQEEAEVDSATNDTQQSTSGDTQTANENDDGDAQQLDSEDQETRARQQAAEARARRARAEQTLRRWLEALPSLDFDTFSQGERVDYLLLKNYLENQLRILTSSEDFSQRELPDPVDESGIRGRPIGRDRLLAELAHEMIDYTPEQLITIAEREYAWCQAEIKKASHEMGFGENWQAAVEKVKSMHVSPGEQPQLIRELAWEAINYLKEHDLVTVPPIAAETWRMQMMSPERQLVNPFFTGGEAISISFPTDTMSHEAKLQSMRGNNVPFARATVHHELIPGHNLQGYMNSRYRTYRRIFSTPFWTEGWALYWEMLLYERGFPQTPEDRVGFLVWRQHRCARIVFSLGYHLGWMKPQECIDYLVSHVGFERNNATAEVRRSFETSYPPLYQAAYMLGGLQIRQLQRDLIGSGKMTHREFHDAILKEGNLPIVMVRALLTNETLTRDGPPQWLFYGPIADQGRFATGRVQ